MTRLAIVIPIFNYEHMFPRWQKTFNDEWYASIKKEFEITQEEISIRYPQPSYPIEEKIISSEQIDGEPIIKQRIIRKVYGKRVGKGKVIRTELDQLKEKTPEYFICIDGDGQIPENSIKDCLRELRKEEIDAVLAKRTNLSGISEKRTGIESFELSLIEKKYSKTLPDGQCGCWGFKYNHYANNKLPLTAEEFEIELDFLINVLRNNLQYTYIPVKVNESTTTSFSEIQHSKKAIFLMKNLNIEKNVLCATAREFNEGKGGIPNEYM